jgi:hypothetical protein
LKNPSKDLWIKLVPFLSPALLFIIACMQFGTASISELSPWKGGGFGMFSTIESPSSRVIRVYLITNGKTRVPVQIPDQSRKLAAQIRTKPKQSDIDKLAVALSNQSWATYKMLPTQEQYYRLHEKYFPGSPLPIDSAANQRLQYAANLNQLFDQMQWIKIVKDGEKADRVLDFESVEVECLQMKFDKAKSKLVLQSIAKALKKRYGNDIK